MNNIQHIVKNLKDHEIGMMLEILDEQNKDCHRRDKAILLLALNTGLRVGELVGLDAGDVKNGTVKYELLVRKEISKGKKERLIPLNASAREAIKTLLEYNVSKNYPANPTSPLLQSRNHSRMTSRRVQQIIQALRTRTMLDINVTPHTLRHTFATKVLRKTNNLRIVQELLGHSSITTTTVYTHPSREDLMEAVANI